jgi:hypothetical protein
MIATKNNKTSEFIDLAPILAIMHFGYNARNGMFIWWNREELAEKNTDLEFASEWLAYS